MMNDLIEIEDLKETCYYVHSTCSNVYDFLIRRRKKTGKVFPKQAIVLLSSLVAEQRESDSQLDLLSGEPAYQIRREAEVFLHGEYTLLKSKLEDSLLYLYGIQKDKVEKEYRYLQNIRTPFFFRYSEKIKKLANRFQSYKHKDINEENIRKWLEQFEYYSGISDNDEKKLIALTLLDNVEYVDINEFGKWYDLLWNNLSDSEKSRIALTPFGRIASSSALMCNDFATKCKLNNKPLKEIPEMLKSSLKLALADENIQDKMIFFVDDVVGTGTQSVRILKELLGKKLFIELLMFSAKFLSNKFHSKLIAKINKPLKEIDINEQLTLKEIRKFKNTFIKLHVFLAIEEGKNELNSFLLDQNINMDVIPYTSRKLQKTFEQKDCGFFFSNSMLLKAKQMAEEIGYYLIEEEAQKRGWTANEHQESALGFGGFQQLLVFDHGPPKFSLPILWKKGIYEGRPWTPIFPRPEET